MDRFGAMLTEHYGGRKSMREVIRTGRLVNVQIGRMQRWQRAEIPKRKPRYARAKKIKARTKYFGRMATSLQEAGVSAVSSANVEHRRLLRVMKRRLDAFERGIEFRHTTHLWPQFHLRRAGVQLPDVQWPGTRGRKARSPRKARGGRRVQLPAVGKPQPA
jgi:hypothetical protein